MFMEIVRKEKEAEDQTRLNLGSWSDIVPIYDEFYFPKNIFVEGLFFLTLFNY